MTASESRPILSAGLDDLARFADPPARSQIAELRRRLVGQRFRILVTGEAKRGKSTLINAMLSQDVLPTGVTPVTAVTTTVTYGTPERVVVRYLDRRHEEHPVADLAAFVTEAANPGNRLGVDQVIVLLDAPTLSEGLELVDTPGTGSVYAHNTREAERAFAAMDAAIFVLTADPPISASERELLVRVAGESVRTFVVLNKVDRLDPAELKQARSFAARVVAEATGKRPRIYTCSARGALHARHHGSDPATSGLPTFEADFRRYLNDKRGAELHRSLARRARALTAGMLDGVRTTLQIGEMRTTEAAERVAAFQRHLTRIARRRAEAADLATAGVQHLLDDLNAEAKRAEPELVAQVVQAARQHVQTELAGLPAAKLQQRGQPLVADTARDVVDAWRSKQQHTLELGLREIEDRLLTALSEELDGLKQAAHELLDLDLVAETDASRLVDNPRFFYLLTEDTGWTELVTATIRRHLPGAQARRRATTQLLAGAERLTSKQIGRVRGDLQYRLQESGRTLSRAVTDRYAASTGRLQDALVDATRLRTQTSEDAARHRAALAEREASLRQVLDNLTRIDATAGPEQTTRTHRKVRT